MDNEGEYLHVYSPLIWHDDAFILGNRKGLEALRDRIDRALEHGASMDATGGFFQNDGEGYTVSVLRIDDDLIDRIPCSYTDDCARDDGSHEVWREVRDRLCEAPDAKPPTR